MTSSEFRKALLREGAGGIIHSLLASVAVGSTAYCDTFKEGLDWVIKTHNAWKINSYTQESVFISGFEIMIDSLQRSKAGAKICDFMEQSDLLKKSISRATQKEVQEWMHEYKNRAKFFRDGCIQEKAASKADRSPRRDESESKRG